MASSSSSNNNNNTSVLLVMMVFLTMTSLWCSACGFEFQVGGSEGWVVPPSNDTNFYNQWASHNRFQLGDSLRFRYKKDSVMEVREEGYRSCNSSRPIMFSNDGNSVFKLGHEGSFYFISGASGHCQKGQKMIVRVLTTNQDDDDDDDHYSSHHPNNPNSSSTNNKFVLLFHFLLPLVASYYVV